jgi:hypothetical protein
MEHLIIIWLSDILPMSVPDEGYSMEHLIIIWLSDILPMSVPDEGYSMEHLIIIWLSDILPMSVPDEGYSRNVSCTLDIISTFLLSGRLVELSFIFSDLSR